MLFRTHLMLTVIVEATLASSEGRNGLRMLSELDANGSSLSVVYRAGQMLLLALIESGSDCGPGPGWKTLTLGGSIRL